MRVDEARREVRRGCGRPRAARIEPPLTFLEPRKRPRQARARATYTAIVDACAQLLAVSPYGSVFALARLVGDGPGRAYVV